MWQLQQKGAEVGIDIFTIDDAVNEISTLLLEIHKTNPAYLSRKASGHV
jgi:pyruvate carboxylase